MGQGDEVSGGAGSPSTVTLGIHEARSAAETRSGVPLLVLHGLFGSARNWATIAQRLAAERPVLALDLRNHGAAGWAPSMTYDEMAGDVRTLVRERGLGRVALLGHSMGGKVAMVLALETPALVERLVVVDVAPAPYPPAFEPYIAAMGSVDLSPGRRRSEVDAALAAAIPDPAVRLFLLQNLVTAGDRLQWRLNLAAIERALPQISGFPEILRDRRYEGPTLFVAGARSTYVTAAHEPTIQRLFPRARHMTIPEAGHWVHAEQPSAFLAAVQPFLAADA